MSAAQDRPHSPKPTAYPSPEFEGQKSGVAIFVTILGVFLGVCLIGGGGIVAAYNLMDEDEDESTVAANTTRPSTNDPFSSRPGNPNTGPRRPVTGTRKIESIDDAVKWLADNSSSKQRDAVRWLSSRPVDSGRQKEIARALGLRLLTGSSFYGNDILDALEVWGDRETGAMLLAALEKRRVDANKLLALLSKFPAPDHGVIAKYLEQPSTANNAVLALKAIGPEAKSSVIVYIGGSNRQADEKSRKLLEGWNVDVDSLLVDRYVQELKSADRAARTNAAKYFAGAELIEERRDEIATALETMLQHSDDSGKTDAIAAIKLWGDKDSIPAIVFVAQKGRIGGSSWAAIDVLGEFKDTRGAAALSEMLEDPSKSTQAKKALTKMGKETAEGEVLKFYNDPDRRARREARLLVHSFETDAALILGQCIADLGTAELARHQGAVEWLATTDKVVEQKRNEVADRLATMLDSKDFSLRENVPKAFAKWATAKHADKMYELLTSRHADVRKNALKTLVVAGHSKLLAPKLNELLKSTLTRKDAIAFLNQVGPSAEDVMIVILLGSEHEDVLMLVCEYLFHHGTKKAQEPLTKFRGIAIKLKKKELSEAASRARAEITKRENAMTEP